MRIVAIHQPAFLPWLGYLHKIAQADIFVLLDTVEYSSGGWTNRNYVKTREGRQLLSVPVYAKGQESLLTTRIDDTRDWRGKHLATLGQNYHRAPRWNELASELERLWYYPTELLSELCLEQLRTWMRELAIETPIVRASEMGKLEGSKTDLLVAICAQLQADNYLSGEGARSYMSELAFKRAGVGVVYQRFVHPLYPQLHGGFIERLGVIDLLLNQRMPAHP